MEDKLTEDMERESGKSRETTSSKVWTTRPLSVVMRPYRFSDRGLHAVFALETQVAIGYLQGDRHENGIMGDTEKIKTVIHVNLIAHDARGDHRRQIFKCSGGRWTLK